MISHQKKFIFIHIHKNAGSAISMFLEPYCEDKLSHHDGILGKEQEIDVHPADRRPGDPVEYKHWKAFHYQKYRPKEFAEYTKFTVVRNPWDRVLSGYIYFSGLPELATRPKEVKNSPNFAKFIKGEQFDSGPTIGIKRIGFTDQYSHLAKSDGTYCREILLLNYERLESSLDALCKILGLEKRGAPLPIQNRSRNPEQKHYAEFYTDETKNLVATIHKRDVHTFGYKFREKR